MSNASDHVYGELRRRLMAGSFLPGERLREEHIAAEMSVSRTPVRNAIERLIADGLVTREERRGAVVLGWQDRDIDEASRAAHAAGTLRRRAGRKPRQRRADRGTGTAEPVHAGRGPLRRPDRVQQVQQLNNQFHHKLLEAAQSARVRAMVENLLDMPIIIGSFYFYGDDDMLRSVEHHRQIIAALRARDAECAALAVRFHLAATHLLFRNHRKGKAQPAAA